MEPSPPDMYPPVTTILISRSFYFHYTFINNQLCKDPPNFQSSWSAILFTIVLPPQMCQLVKWVIFYQWTVAYMALAPCQFLGGGWESASSNSMGASYQAHKKQNGVTLGLLMFLFCTKNTHFFTVTNTVVWRRGKAYQGSLLLC